MKIGLVRHFKVKHPFPKKLFVSRAEVIKWFDDYEIAALEYKKVDLFNIQWEQCYSSPLNRAITTANNIYKGKIIQVPELKELDILHLLPNKIKLPFIVWGILVRIKSLSKKNTHTFNQNIAAFIDKLALANNGNVLIVSHWFVMRAIQKELVKRGLKCNNLKSPDYAMLYVFET